MRSEIHRGGLTGPGPPTEQTESESREFKILLYVLRLEQELAMMLRLLVINTRRYMYHRGSQYFAKMTLRENYLCLGTVTPSPLGPRDTDDCVNVIFTKSLH